MSGKALLLQCDLGISAAMVAGALLDLGADEQALLDGLLELGIDINQVQGVRTTCRGIQVCELRVREDSVLMEVHEEPEIELPELLRQIRSSGLSDRAKELAAQSIQILAEAEAEVSGIKIPDVSFSKRHINSTFLGMIAAAICCDNLEIEKILIPYLTEGAGTSAQSCGVTPVPEALAIVQKYGIPIKYTDTAGPMITPDGAAFAAGIRAEAGIDGAAFAAGTRAEAGIDGAAFAAGTRAEAGIDGAAFAAGTTAEAGLDGAFHILGSGYGGRTCPEDPSTPGEEGYLRAVLIQRDEEAKAAHTGKIMSNTVERALECSGDNTDIASDTNSVSDSENRHDHSENEDQVWELSANLDDSTGEMLGYAMELLLDAGALDVFYLPIFMKKNRPAYMLNVLCREVDIARMEAVIFRNTTTIGIRKVRKERSILNRKIITVATIYGEMQLKVCSYQDMDYAYPEYESVKKAAREHQVSYEAAYTICKEAYQKHEKE